MFYKQINWQIATPVPFGCFLHETKNLVVFGASWWMRLLRATKIAFSRKSKASRTTTHLFATLTPSVFLDNFIRHSLITKVTTYGWMTTAAAVFREETKRKIIMRSLPGGGSEASSVVLSWFLMRILCRTWTTNVIFQSSIMLVFAVVALLSDLYDKSFRWVFLGVNELI